MSDQHPDSIQSDAVIRWPTGVMILLGLLIGAFVGVVMDAIPVGMVTGLALGAGIDSILNRWLNESRDG